MNRKTNVVENACLLFLSILVLSNCKPASDTHQEATFVPHPQKVAKQHVEPLNIGSAAPDFKLPDVSGKFYSLNDFKDAKILVILFSCNHCPTAQAYEDRMIQFTKDYADKGVAVAAIMPNSVYAVLPEECGYTDLNDSYEEMQIRAKDKGYNFPYLYDGDDQVVTIKYGPVATPHAYVFDGLRKLRYIGRLDSLEKPGKAHAEDLRAATDELLAGKEVEHPVNKSFGCSIKWGWKDEWNQHVEKEWNERPVTLEKLKAAEIKALVNNDSKKLRLINIWATWCAPCVAEYPSLVTLQRMFGARSFEFVSLSADKPGNADKTLEFLKTKHSPIKNYLYDGDNNYKLVEAVDSVWNGALPYTLLVEPGGKIVYRSAGPVDLLELKRAIVDNPMIGRYY